MTLQRLGEKFRQAAEIGVDIHQHELAVAVRMFSAFSRCRDTWHLTA